MYPNPFQNRFLRHSCRIKYSSLKHLKSRTISVFCFICMWTKSLAEGRTIELSNRESLIGMIQNIRKIPMLAYIFIFNEFLLRFEMSFKFCKCCSYCDANWPLVYRLRNVVFCSGSAVLNVRDGWGFNIWYVSEFFWFKWIRISRIFLQWFIKQWIYCSFSILKKWFQSCQNFRVHINIWKRIELWTYKRVSLHAFKSRILAFSQLLQFWWMM